MTKSFPVSLSSPPLQQIEGVFFPLMSAMCHVLLPTSFDKKADIRTAHWDRLEKT